jgi:hypothetical protein
VTTEAPTAIPVPSDQVVAELAPLVPTGAFMQRRIIAGMTTHFGFRAATPERRTGSAFTRAMQIVASAGYLHATLATGMRDGGRLVILGRRPTPADTGTAALDIATWAARDTTMWRYCLLRYAVDDPARWATLNALAAERPGLLELAVLPEPTTPSWLIDAELATGWIDTLATLRHIVSV